MRTSPGCLGSRLLDSAITFKMLVQRCWTPRHQFQDQHFEQFETELIERCMWPTRWCIRKSAKVTLCVCSSRQFGRDGESGVGGVRSLSGSSVLLSSSCY
mmetsp:Transcript_1357/g.3649  ORF Transcript_1357/g.3649 Transcript_1357/m.3649 type:complete len:100 (+) Transcript_1357:343-642(+)